MKARRTISVGGIAVALMLSASCSSSSGGGGASSPGSASSSPAAAGSGSTTSTSAGVKQHFTIAYSAWATKDPFSGGVLAGLKKTTAALGDQIVLVGDANFDPEKQGRDVRDIIVKHPDAMILSATDAAQSKVWVKQLTAAGIKVFTLLQAVDKYGLPLYPGVSGAVQFDEKGAGASDAKILAPALQPGASVGVILGPVGFPEVKLRYDGFREELLKHGNYKFITSPNGAYTPANGLSQCQAMVATHPDVKAIFVEGDNATIGCIKAPNIGNRKVLSIGGSPPDLAGLRSGAILGAACYLPEPFAAAAAQDLHQILLGKRKEGLLRGYVPLGVTKETIASCPRK